MSTIFKLWHAESIVTFRLLRYFAPNIKLEFYFPKIWPSNTIAFLTSDEFTLFHFNVLIKLVSISISSFATIIIVHKLLGIIFLRTFKYRSHKSKTTIGTSKTFSLRMSFSYVIYLNGTIFSTTAIVLSGSNVFWKFQQF